jgi:vitamin B12 transporter
VALLRPRLARAWTLFMLAMVASATAGFAQTTVEGTVSDPSGAVIPHAHVDGRQGTRTVVQTVTDNVGRFVLTLPAAGSYQLQIGAPGFRSKTEPLELKGGQSVLVQVALSLDSLSQQVTVTATGTPTLQQNIGSSVAVLTQDQFQHTRDIQEALRLIPGVQVTQTGQAGGITALYIRGGNSNANKVLIDGIGINDIGGGVDFANLASPGIQKVEVLRGPNSAIYGADALSGVVSLSTPQGTTPLPQLDYLGEGGNFGTYRQEGTLSGHHRPFDYFADFSRFDSSNAIPRNTFHNGTLNSNFGWSINTTTDLRATIHHDQVASGQPNAILLYGIPDNTKQANEDSYAGITFDNQTIPHWHNSARYGLIRLRSQFTDFSPTGIPQYDPEGNLLGYLGAPVTIKGANGFTVSGQAQYQFVENYPSSFPNSTDRDFLATQSDYRLNAHVVGLFGFRYENERGYSGGPSESINRNVYDYSLQLAGDFFGRLHYVVGSGLEKNGLFGFAPTPRASLAYDLVESGGNTTKLRASFGKGIKEPALLDQETSLKTLLASVPNGRDLISQYHVSQIGPENSRSFDGGVDQTFADGRGRIGITLFHSQYTNGIDYIAQQGLIVLGIPPSVVAAAPFGATVNSQAFRAQGVDFEAEQQIASHWFARGGYTYLDAVVQRSFTSDAMGPSFNPNFPGIPIGAVSPLVGARPFRRAPHSAYFGVSYTRARFSGLVTGTLVGRRDDTDFLSNDANYLPTLLLPNRNLDGAYQRLDLAMNYAATRRLTIFTSVQNLLSEHYSEAFGYPALPFTFRSGVRISLGGESWKWN